MAIVIDEVVSEPAGEPRAMSAPAAGGAAPGAGEPDLDKLDYQFRRARQRSARLFAD